MEVVKQCGKSWDIGNHRLRSKKRHMEGKSVTVFDSEPNTGQAEENNWTCGFFHALTTFG